MKGQRTTPTLQISLLRHRQRLVGIITAITTLFALTLGVTPWMTSNPTHSARAATPPVLYTQNGCARVYAQPSTTSTIITDLLGGADVRDLGRLTNNGATWEHIEFWSGIEGYVEASALGPKLPQSSVEVDCAFPGVPDPQPDSLPGSNGPWPLAATGVIAAPAALQSQPNVEALPVDPAPLGTHVKVVAWASDATGAPWYEVTIGSVTSWLSGGSLRLDQPDPITRQVRGKPIWAAVAGKGMWFTNYLARHSDMAALMRAAKLAGITHLYAEVAISRYGFYGRNSLDRLLPAAHAAGISVIAWVYPTLDNVAADARMTQQVASYVTPSGDRADGIATDVEEVDDTASVYTYGQLVRALLGPDILLVAAVYHPFAETYYPYAAIAESWNVLAPMDYWHSRSSHQYTPDEVARFVGNSLTTIQAAATILGGAESMPIEELGQTYDMYSGDGAGRHSAPTAAEITADMATARQFGAIGVSFFEWQTTTFDEWSAVTNFRW